MRLGVVDEPLSNGASGHVFEAEGLGADLQFVVVEFTAMASFVLHWVKLSVVFFDQVGFADKAVAIALEPNSADLPGIFTMSSAEGMDAIVETRTFEGVLVIDEFACAEHAPAAMGAVGVLVEGGDGDVVGHGD